MESLREYKRKRLQREVTKYRILYNDLKLEVDQKNNLINRIILDHTEKEVALQKKIYDLEKKLDAKKIKKDIEKQ